MIDYTQQSFTGACTGGRKFDGVIDSMGGQVETDSLRCLSFRGVFIGILNKRMSPMALIHRSIKGLLGCGPRWACSF